jgi:hypothetical protein
VGVKGLSINTRSVKEVFVDASLDMNVPITLDAAVEYKSLDLEKLWPGLSPVFSAPHGLSVKGKGAIKSSFKVTVPERALPHVTGRADLTLTGGGFSSPDATMVGEGIVMKVTSGFELSLPNGRAEFKVNAEASDFELLLGRFYGDFKKRGLKLSLEGEYIKDIDTVKVARAELSLKDIGTILVSGVVSSLTASPSFDTELRLVKLSNRETYGLFIRETFQESFPFLSRLDMGGTTSVEISAKGTLERFNAKGEIKVADMDIIGTGGTGGRESMGGTGGGEGSGPSISGINVALPVDISYPDVSSRRAIDNFGYFRIQNISWGALKLNQIELFPALWQNDFVFREDIVVPVFGGNVRLKDVYYKDILGPGRALILRIDIDGIDLAELSVALGMPGFTGSFSGTIPKVSFVGTNLLTEGEILLELFGGELRVSEISINNVFSPAASLNSTIEFKEIDLGKLTGTFEFGNISGVLQGYVKDLVIANGQPESFEALVETVKRRGVGQKISVEALEKISIIGTGFSARVLNRVIYQLFKEYKYSKMGFRGWLKNDTFLLLGIEMEGEKGYLVKGGLLPPKVNVISYVQVISFREMVKRLKRVRLVGPGEGVRVE